MNYGTRSSLHLFRILDATTLKSQTGYAFRVKLPIPKAQFDQGEPIQTLENQILIFVGKNRLQAYTAMEIYAAVLHPPVVEHGAGYDLVCIALEGLIGKLTIYGRVVKTSSGEETYYAAR